MQLTNSPGKLVLPFANAGAKNTIPTASQIGITAGAASLVDGFPPLTRTPIAAGGVPPSGLDMNGILYKLSAILRWANAGGGYAYDAVFATDSNVGGYPKGARILRSDSMGYWLNTVENNTTDPEAVGAAAAGWVPDFNNGVTDVTMTSANVTLTPFQYGKPIIIIYGALTANLNLIFPNIVNEWTVINNTTGPYTITCKTAAGTGVIVNTSAMIVGNGTGIYSGNLDAVSLLGANVGSAGGTADALTVNFGSTIRSWAQIAGIPFWLRAASANATTTPTLAANGLAAKTYVKGANGALALGDIAGAGHWLLQQYDATLDKVVLLNPANGVVSNSGGKLLRITRYTAASSGTWTKQADTNSILVRAVAGGGGGGGASSGGNLGGNGGYSGCYGEKLITSPSASYAYVVGAAGGGGAVNGAGSAGGQTSFGAMTLTGGPGGQGGLGALVALPTGSGWDFTSASAGGPGQADSTANIHAASGVGGPSPFAGGGVGSSSGTLPGNYGSGGGGGPRTSSTGYAGSAGGAGYIEVWEYA